MMTGCEYYYEALTCQNCGRDHVLLPPGSKRLNACPFCSSDGMYDLEVVPKVPIKFIRHSFTLELDDDALQSRRNGLLALGKAMGRLATAVGSGAHDRGA